MTGVDHLFCIRYENKAMFLPEEQAVDFQHTVVELIIMCSRTIRGIQTTVTFLLKGQINKNGYN